MVRDIPSVVSHHWKNKSINWPMGIYISLIHVAAVAGVLRLGKCSAETLMWAFILWPIRYVSPFLFVENVVMKNSEHSLTLASFSIFFLHTVVLVLQLEFIDCGLIGHMKQHSLCVWY